LGLQGCPFLLGKLESEIIRESVEVPAVLLVEAFRWHCVNAGQVAIQDNPLVADQADESRDIVGGDDCDFGAHGEML
jgi:hypothetical protein